MVPTGAALRCFEESHTLPPRPRRASMAGRERHDNEGIERRRANKEIHVRSVFANFRSPWQIEMLKNHYPACDSGSTGSRGGRICSCDSFPAGGRRYHAYDSRVLT
jgi:hypothetical protein